MLTRLFPAQVDNGYQGPVAALWLLWAAVGFKALISVNSLFNTADVAAIDGVPLDTLGPVAVAEVLTLFALMSLAHLALEGFAVIVLLRYRALVPLAAALLLAEHLARRALIAAHAAPGEPASAVGLLINAALLAAMALALFLSLLPQTPLPGGRGRSPRPQGVGA